MKLTQRQHDLLKDIRYSGHTWHRPMDLGGGDSSDHSAVLNQLTRKGLVQRKLRVGSRRSYLYAITDAGKALMKRLRPDPISRQIGAIADMHATLEDAGAF